MRVGVRVGVLVEVGEDVSCALAEGETVAGGVKEPLYEIDGVWLALRPELNVFVDDTLALLDTLSVPDALSLLVGVADEVIVAVGELVEVIVDDDVRVDE